MNDRSAYRILALDVRARRLGYVVFEIPDRLIDWGICSFDLVAVSNRIQEIVSFCHPSVVVVRRLRSRSRRNTVLTRRNMITVKDTCRRNSIAFASVNEHAIATYFQLLRRRTKHDIAVAVSHRFAELRWKLPAKRRTWQPEDGRMLIFDAAALALSYAWAEAMINLQGIPFCQSPKNDVAS